MYITLSANFKDLKKVLWKSIQKIIYLILKLYINFSTENISSMYPTIFSHHLSESVVLRKNCFITLLQYFKCIIYLKTNINK